MVETSIPMLFIWIACYFSLCSFGTVSLCDALTRHDSCTFNQLCTCLKSPPDLGTMSCINVPMTTIPALNATRLNELIMESNELRLLGERHFVGTGMQNLQIINNPLMRIPAEAFAGLEKTLIQLELRNDHLYFFPRQAIRSLSKLKRLDLSNNFIPNLSREDFHGLELTLQNIILSNNDIIEITQDVFSNLNALETLDLGGNRLAFIYEAFRNGPHRLRSVDLSDNIFDFVPFSILRNVKSLIKLNLSHNRITAIVGLNGSDDIQRFTLEELVLSYNFIKILQKGAFRQFASIDRLYLNFNPITSILDDAFLGVKITELHLRSCYLKHLSPGSFNGINSQLHLLDVSHNQLTERVMLAAFENMTELIDVFISGNDIRLLPSNTFLNSGTALKHLHLEAAGKMSTIRTQITKQDLRNFTRLRSLAMSHFSKGSLTADELQGLSAKLEKLIIRASNLQSLDFDAFRNMLNLKSLDLSSNKLERIHENAFSALSDSLENLDLSNAFAPSLAQLPNALFKSLIKLKHLDLSNNRLKILPRDLFDSVSDLQVLNLQDNAIENIEIDTFTNAQDSKLGHLNFLKLSFNRIMHLDTSTFKGLKNLRFLYLDDNDLRVLEKEAFVNLKNLEYLDLSGNRIHQIKREAFSDMPNLAYVNLAYNSLQNFSLFSLGQVGTKSYFKIDVSHNHIEHLVSEFNESLYGSIKILDFSNNNISYIGNNYFDPIKDIIRELGFSYNNLQNVTKAIFSDMPYLVTLKLNNNKITWMDPNSFEKSTLLRVVDLSHNHITALAPEIFSHCPILQYLDISKNQMEKLPNDLLGQSRQLKALNFATNNLTSFPTFTLSHLTTTLNRMDFSHNQITYLPSEALLSFTNLVWLDLSFNQLKDIDPCTFKKYAPKLRFLNIASNPFQDPVKSFSSEIGGHELEEINLSNTGLQTLPTMNVPNLLRLNLSRNGIAQLQANFQNMINIREIDLSYNEITRSDSEIRSVLPKLRFINLAHNAFTTISNESFTGLTSLNVLNMQGLSLKMFQNGALQSLKSLRALQTNLYDNAINEIGGKFDLFGAIGPMLSLQSLELHLGDRTAGVQPSSNLILQSNTNTGLPLKLNKLVIRGKNFKNFGNSALTSLQNRYLHLKLFNTSATSISSNVFKSASALQFLQLEVSQNDVISIEDPITADEIGARGIFLTDFHTEQNQWQCDCNIGWIEHWMRHSRQRYCSSKGLPQRANQKCQEMIQDFRISQCQNKMNKSILTVLKDELECTWKPSFATNYSPKTLFVALLAVSSTIFAILF